MGRIRIALFLGEGSMCQKKKKIEVGMQVGGVDKSVGTGQAISLSFLSQMHL